MAREQIVPTTYTVDNLDVPFIDLTICPDFKEAYKEEVLKTYGLDKYTYQKKGVYVNLTNNGYDDLQDIYESITYNVDEVISWIIIDTQDWKRDGFKIKLNRKNAHDDITIITHHWSILGRCYTIRPKSHLIKQGIVNIDIGQRMDTYIYFSYPGQFKHPNTMTKVMNSSSYNHTELLKM